MSPLFYQYTLHYTHEQKIEEFKRRIEWSYPYFEIAIVDLELNHFFAWVLDDEYFEGSHKHKDGKFKRRVIPSEVGM